MENQAEIKLYIRFALDQLPSDNAHHKFELVCYYLTRDNIMENVLPATGPVAHYGDQGRDFLQFKTHLDNTLSDNSSFLGKDSSGRISAFTCSIAESIESKIKNDIEKIMEFELPINEIHYFARENVRIGIRNELKLWAHKEYNVNLEIYDGNGIASLLSLSKNHWITTKYLDVSKSLLTPALNLKVFFDKEGTAEIIEFPKKNQKTRIITANEIHVKERSGHRDRIKQLEYDSFFRSNIKQKEAEATEITQQFDEYYKNRKIQFFLFNKGTMTCTDIDITIETILTDSFIIKHKTQIQKPYIPSLSQKHREIMRAHKKVWDLREKDNKVKIYEDKNTGIKITPENLNGEIKWTINYHIEKLRHKSPPKELEPIKIYVPENPPTSEIVFNCSFVQTESGIVNPQELKIRIRHDLN